MSTNTENDFSSARKPPGLKGRRVRNFLERTQNYAELLTRLHDEYGEIASFNVLKKKSCALFSPELVHELLMAKRHHFQKGPVVTENKVLRGKTLFTSDGGEDHLRRRKLAQPSFHRKAIAGYARVMVEEAEHTSARWQDDSVIDVCEDLHALTLQIAAHTFFGDETTITPEVVSTAMNGFVRWGILGMVPFGEILRKLPVRGNVETVRALAAMDEAISTIIRLAHEDPEREELIALLVNARDEDGIYAAFEDWEVRDEAIVILIAGHETTANAMTWVTYQLARNAEVKAGVERELRDVLDGRVPVMDDYGSLPYLKAVCDETLRLCPPIFFMGRHAMEDCTLGEYFIEKGTVVQPATFVIHRNPEYFPEPDKFRPERWLDGKMKKLPKCAYMPFGGGARVCIGEGFAKMELVLVLASLLQKWSIERTSDREIEIDTRMVYQPKGGLSMRVRHR